MSHLTIHFFGPVTLECDGEPIRLPYDKVRALCAFLVIESERPQHRAKLANLFWPDKPESSARHGLSQALSTLRGALRQQANAPPLLDSDRQTVQFLPSEHCSVDVLEFLRLTSNLTDPVDPLHLLQAVELYRGSFLEGLAIDDCPEFEDWQRSMQSVLESRLATALQKLMAEYESQGEFAKACQFAQQLLELDQLDEDRHRTMMRLLAAGGQRAAAIRQYERCVDLLNQELGVEPEPETTSLLSSIRADAERVASSRETSTLLGATQAAPTLPVPGTSIIGRDNEIQEILEQFRNEESRLITLVGPGGIGKTRLALEVARAHEPFLEDGAFLVSLSGTDSPDLVASTILNAIDANMDPQRDPVDQLRAFLASRTLLLLLDNFEHLLEGAVLIQDLLEHAPGLHLLVTSRERLALSSETVYEVEELTLPSGEELASIAVSGATRLFMARARKHDVRFLPDESRAPAIARIAHLTGGMPLAIELAAAWIPVLSPEEIASEIEQSLDFLSSEIRDIPERHRSIRAVVNRSWESLLEIEQRAFRRLSVFPGGFTRNAASYVTGTSLPVLSALVSKSLIRHSERGRYEIHELLRQFGAGELKRSRNEEHAVRNRFRDYYLGFVAARAEQLKTHAQSRVLSEITAEMDNIRAGWWRAIETADIEGLLKSAHTLWLYFDITDRYIDGITMFSAARQAVTSLSPSDIVPSANRIHSLADARIRSRESALSFRMEGSETLQIQVRKALAMIDTDEEPGEAGLLCNYMACTFHVQDDLDKEHYWLNRSIEYFKRAYDYWGLAYSWNDLGQLWVKRGEFHKARELHRDALSLLEDMGDQRGIAFALRNLGIAESQLGNTELAIEYLERSIQVRGPIGNRWGTAESLSQIAKIHRNNRQYEAAEEQFRAALEISREIGALQLASQILREFLPMLSTEGPDAFLSDWAGPVPSRTFESANPEDLSDLLDSLLGADSSVSERS
jgi:predicted ATPase/DNA-binding SARP family transcriptional activator